MSFGGYYENRDCEYYPCHDMEHLNCMFCYCPFYREDNCPGSPTYITSKHTGEKIKDCSHCLYPHKKENYDAIMERINAKTADRPRVVFLDVDGTLIDYNGEFPDSAKEAMRMARRKGHQMVVCTGRALCQLTGFFPMELLDGVITAAGSCVYHEGELLMSTCFEEEWTKRLVDYFKENDMPFFLQAEDQLYSATWCKEAGMELFRGKGLNDEAVEKVYGTVAFVEEPWKQPGVEKALYYNCQKNPEEVCADLGGYFNITDSSYKLSRFCDGEITRAGIDKSAGMRAYLDHVGIPREDSIAFGDGPNDLEMIRFAGIGVAMGNATLELKQAANRVCGDVNNDGLYFGFQSLGLIDE